MLHILLGTGGWLLLAVGYALGILVVLRVLDEQRTVGAAWAWLLLVVLIPWLGVPLYLLLGGHTLRFVAGRRLLDGLGRLRGVAVPQRYSHSAAHLVRFGAAPPLPATEVRVVGGGVQAWRLLLELVAGARSEIDVSIFILARDSEGRALVEALAARAAEGLRVRLLLDAMGCLFTRGRFVEPLRRAGGEVEVFLPLLPWRPRWSANLRNHRKILVVDGEKALVGGMNVGHLYLGPEPDPRRWRDLMLLLRGPVVSALQQVFESDWSIATGSGRSVAAVESFPAGVPVQVVPDGPDQDPRPFSLAVLSALRLARREIVAVTPYFVPDEALLGALLAAAGTGVRVRLLLPERSNHRAADLVRRPAIRELVRAGAEVLLHPGMVHGKCAVVDGEMCWVSSSNLDMRSLALNFEVAALLYDSGVAQDLLAWYGELAESSRPVRREDMEGGLASRIVERALWLVAPLL